MTEQWIYDAFEQAQKEYNHTKPIAKVIGDFLESETPRLLDIWGKLVGKDKMLRMARLFASNQDLGDDIADMCKVFAIAGFLYNKYLNEHER